MPRRFGLTAPEMHQLDQVIVEAGVRQKLLSAARSAPGEACAALYGTVAGSVLRLAACRPLENAAAGACLAIPVGGLLADEHGPADLDPPGPSPGGEPARSRPAGPPRRLVGLFHSHPDSDAVPSDLDCLAIARLPFVWVIAGRPARRAGPLRFFAWSAEGVRELPGR